VRLLFWYNFGIVPFQFLTRLFSKAPKAAAAYKQAGGSAQHAYWLFAAPVHMQLGRDSYFLATPAPILTSGDDALALVLSLNQHFNQVGLYFYLQDAIWFLGLGSDPKITTTSIEKVVNQDVAPYLPQGEGALAWAKLQNEIQMLLFTHPVNVAREARGEPPINSLWFYGLSS
jgi:hypothetical protein